MMSEGGYPIYCRCSPEEGGNSFFTYRKRKPVTYTNGDVVPYNKYLLYKYNCNINVEYYNSVMAIKYHLKYINKGSDEAIIAVERKTTKKIPMTQKIIRMNQRKKSESFRTSDM